MNGLQFVSISLGKRIRCLPICPPGTRGRILSRRLAQAAQIQSSTPAPSRLGAEAILSISQATTAALHRLQDALERAIRESRQSHLQQPAETTPTQRPNEPLDAALTGLDAVATPDPDTILGGLLNAIDRKEGLRVWDRFMEMERNLLLWQLSPAQFSALLRSLRPNQFLKPMERHRLGQTGKPVFTNQAEAFAELHGKLTAVVKAMLSHRHRLTARDYHHLIDCARAAGDRKMTFKFWNNLCGNNLQVDTWSYNSYMAGVTGTASYERERRVNEVTLAHRAKRKPEDMRRRATEIFEKMVVKGISPNSMTFDILLLGMARMGDLAGVETTLKRVWGVDVHALPNETAVAEKRIAYPRDSPMYPTSHTLLAVALAFSQNGNVDVAIRAVDHFSRLYRIPISTPTWVALANWTYVYTRKRENSLPAPAMERLWNIMTGPPYNISPTAEMYDYIIRSYLWRCMPDRAEMVMDSAVMSVLGQLIERAKALEDRIARRRMPGDGSEAMARFTANEIEMLKRQVAKLLRAEHTARSMLKRWIELMVLGKCMKPMPFGPRRVPEIIDKWNCFLGERLVYVLRTGYVELDLGKEPDKGELSGLRTRRWWVKLLGTGAKEEDDFF